jgi:hypothetical protein
MAAGVAMKSNPVLKIFADRLQSKGYRHSRHAEAPPR